MKRKRKMEKMKAKNPAKLISANNHFFTMIELLVVISIIILLVSILLPALKNARNTAYSVVCFNRMKQIGTTLNYYDSDFNGWFPTAFSHANGWGRFLRGTDYISADECIYEAGWRFPKRLGCPVAEKYSLSANGYRVSYRLYGMNGQKPLYYNNDKYVRTNEFLRLGRIRDVATYAYLGDAAATDSNPPQADYHVFYNNLDATNVLHLRHNKKANVWFLDGHVAGLNAPDMSSANGKINISSFYSY